MAWLSKASRLSWPGMQMCQAVLGEFGPVAENRPRVTIAILLIGCLIMGFDLNIHVSAGKPSQLLWL